MLKSRVLLIGVCALVLSACDRDGVGDPRTVPEGSSIAQITALAEAELAKNRRQNAADYYLEIERLYPYTPAAEQALIKAAQSYYDGGALVESRIAAERYLQFFPGSPNAALAQYLVALSYYDGIVDISRDQERTFLALQALQAVMDKFPKSKYAELAKPKFDICLNQLAGKEMEIGRYYLRRKHYPSAINRFKAVISEYPANNHTGEAYHRLIESYLSLGLRDEALTTFNKFKAQASDSPWFARSKQLLETGSQPNSGSDIFRQMLTS